MSELEKYRKAVTNCIRCGICRVKYDHFQKIYRGCPPGEHSAGFWTDFPVGRIGTGRDILEGRLSLLDAPVEAIYECALCANCRQICGAVDMATGKPLIDTPAIVKALRADLFAAGAEIPRGAVMMGESIEKTHNVFGAPEEERVDWLSSDIKVEPKADTVFFPGCLTAYRSPEIARATAKILNKAGMKFSILGEEEYCCGNPLIMTGQLPLAREVARYNWEQLKGKRVITSCPGCARCFKMEYPKLMGDEFKVNVVHIVELLPEFIETGKIKLDKEVREKIVYHDPCELGREMGVYEQPRKVIQSIPGVDLVEMVRNRERNWCCGGGGGLKGANYDLSLEIGKDKLEQLLATGATRVISACPSCKISINDAIRATGANLKAIDITELVADILIETV